MKYICCIDFSEASDRAFHKMVKLLRAEDTVILLTVVELYTKNVMRALQVDFDFQILDEANLSLKQSAKESMDDYRKKLEQQRTLCSLVIMEGNPKELIPDVCKKEEPDVLVMGSRGLGLLKGALFGSVSNYCVQYAGCDVLIVH